MTAQTPLDHTGCAWVVYLVFGLRSSLRRAARLGAGHIETEAHRDAARPLDAQVAVNRDDLPRVTTLREPGATQGPWGRRLPLSLKKYLQLQLKCRLCGYIWPIRYCKKDWRVMALCAGLLGSTPCVSTV